MTNVTEADRERVLMIRRATSSCGHGMWYPIDCDDCLAHAIASAREAGEAKGREEERAECLAALRRMLDSQHNERRANEARGEEDDWNGGAIATLEDACDAIRARGEVKTC